MRIYFADRKRWRFANWYQLVSCGAAGQHETLHAAMGDSRDRVGISVEYRGLSVAFQRKRRYQELEITASGSKTTD